MSGGTNLLVDARLLEAFAARTWPGAVIVPTRKPRDSNQACGGLLNARSETVALMPAAPGQLGSALHTIVLRLFDDE